MKPLRFSVMLVALVLCAASLLQANRGQEQRFQKAIHLMETKGDYPAAIRQFEKVVKGPDRTLAARSLLYVGLCHEQLGQEEAQKAYQRLIEEFADQREVVAEARTRLAALSPPADLAGGSGIVVHRVLADAADGFFTGAPSLDGKYLSYVDWETGGLAVWELASGKNRRLTESSWSDGSAFSSIFSPDSKHLAYTWFDNDGVPELRIVGLDGSGPRVLYGNEEVGYPLPADWSADGKHILAVFGREDGINQIVLVAVADGSAQVLKSLDWSSLVRLRMSLSPDGQYIAYSFPPEADSRNRDIFLLAADGSREIPLIKHPADDFVLGWAPDGKRIAFGSDRTGSMGAWIIQVADGRPQGVPELVRPEMGEFHPLGLTRTGSYYYGLYSGWSDVYTATLDLGRGKLLDPPVRAIQRFEGSNSAPEWSPDGQYLVCRSGRSGAELRAVLLIRSFETGAVRELAPKLGSMNFHFLRWSPDGRSILAIGPDKKGRYGFLFQIDVRTGEATIIARPDSDLGGTIYQPNWSPDGKTVFFVRSGDTRRVVQLDLEHNLEKELLHVPITEGGIRIGVRMLTLSPDGRQLAFLSGGALKLLSVGGGEPRELVKVKGISTIAWMPDGRQLLYGRKSGDDDMRELWRISIESGKPKKLELAMPRLMHLRVHPDGRRIAFTAQTQPEKSEVWMMENFLPELTATK